MNPWNLPETGNTDSDLAAALRARYGASNQDIFQGYGSEVGLSGPGVPPVHYAPGALPPQEDWGKTNFYDDGSARILVDPNATPDIQQSTLAHELAHAADTYSAPYPLNGAKKSHHYFYGQFEPELNRQLRNHMAQEDENQASRPLPNPWAQIR